jgi:hypothetical protein
VARSRFRVTLFFLVVFALAFPFGGNSSPGNKAGSNGGDGVRIFGLISLQGKGAGLTGGNDLEDVNPDIFHLVVPI